MKLYNDRKVEKNGKTGEFLTSSLHRKSIIEVIKRYEKLINKVVLVTLYMIVKQ